MAPAFYFDACAAILTFTIGCSCLLSKKKNNRANRLFYLILFSAFLAAIFSVCSALSVSDTARKNICQYGIELFRSLIAPVYFYYIITITDTWHKFRGHALLKPLPFIPYTAIALLLVLNPFTDCLFYFDEDMNFVSGVMYPILDIWSFAYFIAGILWLLRYRQLFGKDKIIALALMPTMAALAFVINIINPNIKLGLLAETLSLLLIAIAVHHPEDKIDTFTGLSKYSVYTFDMKRNFENKKVLNVILINISNFDSLRATLHFDALSELLEMVSNELDAISKSMKINADLYYLDRGRYRFVIEEEYRDMTSEAALRINEAMKKSFIVNGINLNLIAYVCAARCPEDISDFKTLMAFGFSFHELPYSGSVMYAADIMGNVDFMLKDDLSVVIDNAIANGNFEIYYQPIFSIEKRKFVSAEALLRLKDEKHGFIPPDLFIPAAEESGAIHKIGEYVIEEVCKFIASDEFKSLGLEYIEVNLSTAQCMQSNLAERILKILWKYGILPEQINFEITETAANYSPDVMMKNIDRLIDAGISFSLDDYGSGYSNAKRVASLPVRIVKIDKTFADEENSEKTWIVLKNTIQMLKELDIKIVVEGVESKQLARRFAELNCEYIQGYFYSKPLPKHDFVEFIKYSAKEIAG